MEMEGAEYDDDNHGLIDVPPPSPPPEDLEIGMFDTQFIPPSPGMDLDEDSEDIQPPDTQFM